MKLTGELKEKVEKAENKEEAKKIIEEADLEMTDEEVEQVAGGMPIGSAICDKPYGHQKR